jgi:hypothetical protein
MRYHGRFPPVPLGSGAGLRGACLPALRLFCWPCTRSIGHTCASQQSANRVILHRHRSLGPLTNGVGYARLEVQEHHAPRTQAHDHHTTTHHAPSTYPRHHVVPIPDTTHQAPRTKRHARRPAHPTIHVALALRVLRHAPRCKTVAPNGTPSAAASAILGALALPPSQGAGGATPLVCRQT